MSSSLSATNGHSTAATCRVPSPPPVTSLNPTDTFLRRHVGPDDADIAAMLQEIGYSSLADFLHAVVPYNIRLRQELDLPEPLGEHDMLQRLKAIASKNKVFRSFLGMGYHDTITPPVIQRNILENPGWYTGYTPYQAEISQGRLEALLNFQTMIIDLTGLDIANASLLDEGTAAAEAMSLCHSSRENEAASLFFIDRDCHPQTIAVVQARALPLGIEVVLGDSTKDALSEKTFGVLLPYPTTYGAIRDYTSFIEKAHAVKALAVVVADLLGLTLLKAPGDFGADVAVGSTQRFGVPLGFGGPHAAYFATRDAYKRQMPGRLIGVSHDSHGNPALRLSLQTREQHIRRDKATSNICTAQVLLAVMASMYAVYHGPEGLRAIATRIRHLTGALAAGLKQLRFMVSPEPAFDTLRIDLSADTADTYLARARERGINLRRIHSRALGITLDETVTAGEVGILLGVFADGKTLLGDLELLAAQTPEIPAALRRERPLLAHPIFHAYHTETELLRYIHRLQAKDLTLTTSMIPLGSCTMKLNATAEMLPVSWAEFGKLHPFAPANQTLGYQQLFQELEDWLAEITGLPGVSLQPNAGSQGEYAGLLAIRAYHAARKETARTVCLIPVSAHGTNPASAIMAGFHVVPVACDTQGNVDLEDLRKKASAHVATLGAIMITYPSTHGVFEETIREIAEIIHHHGGLVYMDGANMNAQVGLCRPGDWGVDVCHLNLHKTFCIPHGGGGPGVGPICCAERLRPYLPGHPVVSPLRQAPSENGPGEPPVSAAPWGSASICVISWAYIAMLGEPGLRHATSLAILNANYIAKRLEASYQTLYKGASGLVAHECILDMRDFKKVSGVEVEDIAKRLIDYGFHAPTMSWPVAGTLMVEPTESESKAELDRFCDAMISIHGEIDDIATGKLDRADNPLKHAPHTAPAVTSDEWNHAYPRQRAAYPAPWLKQHKFWSPVGRVDNVYGDRNLVCSCLPMEAYTP